MRYIVRVKIVSSLTVNGYGISLVHEIISLSVLLFGARVFAEILQRFKMPVVLGELLDGTNIT